MRVMANCMSPRLRCSVSCGSLSRCRTAFSANSASRSTAQHRDRVPVELLACVGHPELARRPVEQSQAEIVLELPDAVTKRRFGGPRRSARGRETAPVDRPVRTPDTLIRAAMRMRRAGIQ